MDNQTNSFPLVSSRIIRTILAISYLTTIALYGYLFHLLKQVAYNITHPFKYQIEYNALFT